MKIIDGDSYKELLNFPNNHFNGIVTDLPYFVLKNVDWDNQWKNLDEYLSWLDLIFIEYNRILKENSNLFIFTGRQYNRHISLLLDKYFTEKRIIIWRRRMMNNTRGKALASGYEPICFYSKGNGIYNNIKIKTNSDRIEYTTGNLKDGISLSDVWDDIPRLAHNSKERLKHPSQKPIKLMERIITIGTKENDLILDNFAGTGTTGIACKNLNRKCVLIDNNKDYIQTINNRFKK